MIGKILALAFGVLFIAFLAVIVRMVLLSGSAKPPARLGVDDTGHLTRCPTSPNCVWSRAESPRHSIPPIAVGSSQEEALAAARQVIESTPGARVVTVDGPYLHAEFTSRLLHFVDDLELLYDPEAQSFEVRSASRVGTSDLGVNRRRVETLRQRLAG